MLNKATVLHELGQAKIVHLRWVKRVDHLVSGLPVEKDLISIDPTQCGFGKWLYGPIGEKLRSEYIFESTIYKIETYHDRIHELYGEIYNILYAAPASRTILHKIVTLGSKKVSKADRERVKSYFEVLLEYSDEMLALLVKLEKAVKAVDMVVLQRREQMAEQHMHL